MSVTLSWTDTNSVEEGYRIYRAESTLDPKNLPAPLATVAANATSYEDTAVTEGVTYYYRVAAYAGAAERLSSEVSILANAVTPTTGFADEIDADSPYLWLRMAETTGAALVDSSGNGRNATIYGGAGTDYDLGEPTLVGDTGDHGIRFKADNGYVRSNSAFTLPLANITLMAVVQIDSGAPAGTILTPYELTNPSSTSGARDRCMYVNTDGYLVAGVWAGSVQTIVSPSVINDGAPHILHFACGADAAEGSELYVDGISIGTMPYIATYSSSSYLYVAKNNYSGWPGGSVSTARGVVCEAAWFNSRLSAARIAAHAAAMGL